MKGNLEKYPMAEKTLNRFKQNDSNLSFSDKNPIQKNSDTD